MVASISLRFDRTTQPFRHRRAWLVMDVTGALGKYSNSYRSVASTIVHALQLCRQSELRSLDSISQTGKMAVNNPSSTRGLDDHLLVIERQ